jgi:hypothetical protein
MTNGAPETGDANALRLAWKAIKFVFLIVLINFIFYVVIVTLHNQDLLGGTVFPTFLLFLALAFSFGILLIIGLRQTVDLEKVENAWIKKIAINPIMAVVAVLISIFASFSPLADAIVPPNLGFMLANVAITCDADNRNTATPPSGVLAVIWAQDLGYVNKVANYLSETPDSYIERLKKYMLSIILGTKPRFGYITFVEKKHSD